MYELNLFNTSTGNQSQGSLFYMRYFNIIAYHYLYLINNNDKDEATVCITLPIQSLLKFGALDNYIFTNGIHIRSQVKTGISNNDFQIK